MKDIAKEFKFLDTPKFNYEYKNEVEILGRKLFHIGEGIFMFEKPFVSDELSLEQFKEKLEEYKDIAFIRFYTYPDNEEDKETWIIPFAMSATHRRHYSWDIYNNAQEYMEEFNIPDSMKYTINNITEKYIKNDNGCHSYEDIFFNQDLLDYRPVDDECTHLLDMEHNTDDGRYMFVNGYVGRKILDGIYYFGDAVSEWGISGWPDKEGLHVRDLHPDDFKENIAFIDKWISLGGTLETVSLEDYKIYYMAIGDSAIGVLSRLYKNLSGYEMHLMKKDAVRKKSESGDFMAFLEECKEKESNRRPIHIPEGACELIDGMGYHNLDIRCKLLFQNIGEKDETNSRGFSKYEVAYILDGKLYLINYNVFEEKEEGYMLDLQMVTELSVRYKVKLFDHDEEDVVKVVIDKENAEKLILGEENFSSYIEFVKKNY